MKLHEALSKSNKVRRHYWATGVYFDYSSGLVYTKTHEGSYMCPADYIGNDWEPILEKKVVYQAVIKTNSNRYFISNSLYCDENAARKDYPSFFVKLLTDRPIEVEVEDSDEKK